MDRELAQFKISDEDGATFYVEVESRQVSRGSGVRRVAVPGSTQQAVEASKTLDAALVEVQPIISKVASRLRSGLTTPADEVEVSFGLKLNAEAGVVFGSVGGEVTFDVTLKWGSTSKARCRRQSFRYIELIQMQSSVPAFGSVGDTC